MRARRYLSAFSATATAVIALAALPALAQDENPTTPGAIPDPSSYQGSMQLQQQEQQQQQQQQQQNQQMQQRLDQNDQPLQGARRSQPRARAGGGSRAVNWWSRPPLPPSRNPMLGRWRQAPSRGSGSPDPISAMVGAAMAGGCNSIFGSGVTAFEPDALQWVAPDGHEEILNHVAYRANGAQVVMLSRDPGAIPALIFDFPSRDRAVVAVFNCALDRVGATPTGGASRAPSNNARPREDASPPPSGPANAVLRFQVGVAAAASLTPLANAHFWVTADDPAPILQAYGAAPTPLRQLVADCQSKSACVRDFKVTTIHTVAVVTSDAAGHAETRLLPAGHYYLIGFAAYQGRTLLWTRPVLLQAPLTTVSMDQTDGGMAP